MPSSPVAIGLLGLLAGSAMLRADDAERPRPAAELLTAAAENLGGLPALEAKMRQRVSLFGHEMVGSGTYQQMTAGRQRMLRLELKMDVAGEVASFQQISDGTTMWVRRDSEQTQRLEYINLRQIRRELAKRANAPKFSAAGNWFALGGLDYLLNALNRNFDFGPPAATQIGEVPVWELTGVWKPTALPRYGVTSVEALPQHLPHMVKVTLGRDQQLPLFPYRIEYGRLRALTESPTESPSSTYVAIAAMDLHGVRHRPDLAARHFSFQPNDQDVIDVTQRYLERIVQRLESPSAADPETAPDAP